MEPIAYRSGQFVSQSELFVPPQDMGFMWGVTVAEQLRTFHGELFELKAHLKRLEQSLEIVGVDVDLREIGDAAVEVVNRNSKLIDAKADLGLTIFVTPGLSATYAESTEQTPLVGIHSYPLRFSLWASKYERGQQCELVSVPQVPKECWPRQLKSRSRMHYYLADQEAKRINPSARAILLTEDDFVNEASTANVVAYFENEGFVSPPLEDILPGITLGYLASMAKRLGQGFVFRRLSTEELLSADEVLLTSTPFCLLPVSRIGDREYPNRSAFHGVMQAWSESVGVDVISQAQNYSPT